MRTFIVAVALVIAATLQTLIAQTPPTGTPASPVFDVVSVKQNTTGTLGSSVNERADGGMRMTNLPVALFISRAYGPVAPAEMVGLPGWAMSERYDVSATSSLAQATAAERAAMLRAMLADRFKLVAHLEQREQSVYELTLARSDGRLGAGLTRIDADCDAKLAADREAALAASGPVTPPQRPDFSIPPPPCTLRSVGADPRNPQGRVGDLLEGEASMANLANLLRLAAGRVVVDKTGLPGSYRVRMTYDMRASRQSPDGAAAADAAPTVFTALQEQLGLKLNAARVARDTLIIDRLERPSEN